MPTGLRLSPDNVDLERFRQFVLAAGAEIVDHYAASGELLRFRVGRHLGRVSQRKNGVLTFCGVARALVQRMQDAEREDRIVLSGAKE